MADVRDEKVTELINAIIQKLEANHSILRRSSHGRVIWRRKGDKVEITLEPTL